MPFGALVRAALRDSITRSTLSIPLATRSSGIPSLSTFGVPTT
ncbi:MAG: hypothetical protein V9F04_04290 [Dermatophilaceae bacterium]